MHDDGKLDGTLFVYVFNLNDLTFVTGYVVIGER